ncbi:MAG: diaminopimelate decarboxylase [Anaerolineae bacterium]|nr:diaminopimelate decarboxylase [Anaerolineae bacterium]
MKNFHYVNNELYCERVSLATIAAEVGTPVYIYSQAEIETRAGAYKTAVSTMPNADNSANNLVCYAVKANGNPSLMRLLGKAGLGADVTSGGELFLALHAGIAPDKIIYSGVGKTRHEIEAALDANIRALHVESEMELEAIADIATAREQVVSIGVRVNPNISAETHPYISTGQHAHKFGVPWPIAHKMLRFATTHPWLKPVSIAAHIGSQIVDVAPFVEAAHFIADLATELKSEGINLHYLDIGGGLGIDYEGKGSPAIAEWLTAVSQPITNAGFPVVVEPGRSIIGPTGLLLTQIVYTKQQGDKHFTIVDAGMNDLLRPTLYNAHHPIQPVKQPTETNAQITNIVGPICETGDSLAKERPLSPTEAGEYLAILQAGAYGFAMGSNYNGRLRPAEVLVNGDDFTIIRKRQRYENLLDGCL